MKPALRSLSSMQCANIPVMQCGGLRHGLPLYSLHNGLAKSPNGFLHINVICEKHCSRQMLKAQVSQQWLTPEPLAPVLSASLLRPLPAPSVAVTTHWSVRCCRWTAAPADIGRDLECVGRVCPTGEGRCGKRGGTHVNNAGYQEWLASF